MKYVMNQETLNQLVNYLAGKPWREVFQIMVSIDQMEQIKEPSVTGEINTHPSETEVK